MSDKTVDTQAALTFGWNTLRDNFVFFLKLLGVLIVLAILPAMVLGKISSSSTAIVSIPVQFINIVWQSVLGMGLLKICLNLYDKKTPSIPDLWSCLPSALNYIVAKFLYTLIISIGLVLLVVPGVIAAIMFYLAAYLIVDKNLGPIEALKTSQALTNGLKWDLGIFASVVLLVNILGLVFLGVGLLITLPVTMLANVYIYRQVLARGANAA